MAWHTKEATPPDSPIWSSGTLTKTGLPGRERGTKSWWHGHIRDDLTLQVAVLGGKGQERLMKTVIIPIFYIVLNKSQTLFKELNPQLFEAEEVGAIITVYRENRGVGRSRYLSTLTQLAENRVGGGGCLASMCLLLLTEIPSSGKNKKQKMFWRTSFWEEPQTLLKTSHLPKALGRPQDSFFPLTPHSTSPKGLDIPAPERLWMASQRDAFL